jgi:ABC-2 type transport system ATP-binding protein
VEDIGLSRPTLDDVFLRLTGHRTADSTDAAKEAVA